MERLTYRGTPQMTEDGMITPTYSDYPTRRIIEKLADYEDKEEQGLLIELPCKVGDRVYFIVGKDISVQKVMSIQLLSNNRIEIYTKRRVLNGNDFDKTVFLTRSEAEEALAKLGGANGTE